MSEQIVLDPAAPVELVNLVVKPSFETGSGGWYQGTSGTPGVFGQVADWSVAGWASLRGTGLAVPVGGILYMEQLPTDAFAVAPGETVSARAAVRANSVPTGAKLSIELLWLTSGGSYISETSGPLVAATNGMEGEVVVEGAVAPATTAKAVVRVRMNGHTVQADMQFCIDAVVAVKQLTAPAYFDGDSEGDTPNVQYRWTGTAHASTSEIVNTRAEFDLNSRDSIRVFYEGLDWGDAQVQSYMAEMARGETPVDFRVPNRQITIPLILGGGGTATFAEARADLLAKVALFQREGGWLRRGDDKFADIVGATLRLPDKYSPLEFETDVVLTLEALPDFYGPEQELSLHTESTLPELVFTETDIDGDYPARTRIKVYERDGDTQYGLLAGVRSRHYSPDATARLAYEAETLYPDGAAAVATRAGASGGGSNNVLRHTNLGTDWTGLLWLALAPAPAPTNFTHTGRYALWARVFSPSGTAVKVRARWGVGDFNTPQTNAEWRFPDDTLFYDAYLGEVQLDKAPAGKHGWHGHIQAKGATAGLDIDIDRIWLQPLDEGACRLSAVSPSAVLFASQSAELRTDGCYRTDVSGLLSAKILPYGDLLRLPPSGLEERSVEVFLKASRGDFDLTAPTADGGIDDIAARVFYRACWLFPT